MIIPQAWPIFKHEAQNQGGWYVTRKLFQLYILSLILTFTMGKMKEYAKQFHIEGSSTNMLRNLYNWTFF